MRRLCRPGRIACRDLKLAAKGLDSLKAFDLACWQWMAIEYLQVYVRNLNMLLRNRKDCAPCDYRSDLHISNLLALFLLLTSMLPIEEPRYMALP